MPEVGPLVMPALYVLTAALVIAVLWAGDGVFLYYLTVRPAYTVVVLGVPLLAWALQNHQLLMLVHIGGAFIFVGGHAASALVAFQLPGETDGARAQALLTLSYRSLDWMHIGLAVLILSGIAAGFVGQFWGRPWIWLALDLLLAISAFMYAGNRSKAYSGARNRLEAGGTAAWDAEARAMVDRRQAMVFMVTGMVALVAITALMIFKPG
ncbi:MAG: hypothetical protein ACRDFZ_01820 [Candidatus Limnocylindria bacterium]